MENRSHALLAGLFTLFLGLAVVWSIWWFGGKHEATTDYTVVTRQNVTGLSLQGQVRYRGIRVGKVQAIELDPRDVRNILIRISVGSAVPVTRGTTAKLGYQGVTGIAHILLEDSGADQVPLRSVDGEPARIAMEIKPDRFATQLASEPLKPVYLIAGSEPLLVQVGFTRVSSISA